MQPFKSNAIVTFTNPFSHLRRLVAATPVPFWRARPASAVDGLRRGERSPYHHRYRTGRGRGVGRALGVGVTLGAGVGVEVAVAVGVGVGVGLAVSGTIA